MFPAFSPESITGDAYIFRSEWNHKVTPLTSGKRSVLVLEFWKTPDARSPTRLDTMPELKVGVEYDLTAGYILRSGWLNPTGDVIDSGEYTWEEATELCDSTKFCIAFTYNHDPKIIWSSSQKFWIDFKVNSCSKISHSLQLTFSHLDA